MNITDKAYQKSIEVLEKCSKKQGFFASGLPEGYEAVWARDSMITSIGACLVENKFKNTFKASIETLAKNQSQLGQIPNCVGSYNIDRKSKITFNSIDSSLWFIIGNYVYAARYNDHSLLEKYKKNIAKAYIWLKYQDPNDDKLLAQQPTMDWEDAFPHKYGRTINTHSLYYAALNFLGKNNDAEYIKRIINGNIQKYLSLYDDKLGHYLPWAWKKHDNIQEKEEWFDSLGNILAIITGLATNKISNKILRHIDLNKINKPYGCKAIWPPIEKGDEEWKPYFANCDARTPFHYLNGGVWPFIGGFYIGALVKTGHFHKAKDELKKLAEANLQKLDLQKLPYKRRLKGKYEFNEWLHGKNGKPKGEPYQGWSAGMYIYAYECVKKGQVFFF